MYYRSHRPGIAYQPVYARSEKQAIAKFLEMKLGNGVHGVIKG